MLISLLRSCQLVGDATTASVLADFHLRTLHSGNSSSVSKSESRVVHSDPRPFQEQFLSFCAHQRHDTVALSFLKRLMLADPDDVARSQMFGQYIGFVVESRDVASASQVVDAASSDDELDVWRWIHTLRRLGGIERTVAMR